jgi:hypothetical protein
MARDTLYNFNFITPPTISREEYYNVGASKFILGYVKRAFWGGANIEIWDSAIGGTQLVQGLDFELTDEDIFYSTETGDDVYTAVRILNVLYQTGSIFITYKPLGSYVDADLVASLVPVGAIVQWPVDAEIPTNWLKCQGQELNRKTYDVLYRKIGTTYGVGDGSTTFNIPDLEDCFIRQSGPLSAAIGTKQGDAFMDHTHDADGRYFSLYDGVSAGGAIWLPTGFTTSLSTGGADSGDYSADETRPTNYAMFFIMRVF